MTPSVLVLEIDGSVRCFLLRMHLVQSIETGQAPQPSQRRSRRLQYRGRQGATDTWLEGASWSPLLDPDRLEDGLTGGPALF